MFRISLMCFPFLLFAISHPNCLDVEYIYFHRKEHCSFPLSGKLLLLKYFGEPYTFQSSNVCWAVPLHIIPCYLGLVL